MDAFCHYELWMLYFPDRYWYVELFVFCIKVCSVFLQTSSFSLKPCVAVDGDHFIKRVSSVGFAL